MPPKRVALACKCFTRYDAHMRKLKAENLPVPSTFQPPSEIFQKLVILLLECDVDMNATDLEFQTPLHWAVLCGSAEAVRIFIDHGIDVNADDMEGRTPHPHAALEGEGNIVECLPEHSADVTSCNEVGQMPFNCASDQMRAILQRQEKKLQSTHSLVLNCGPRL